MTAGIRDLTPNTADWHAAQAGMLSTQLQILEFQARLGIAYKTGSRVPDLWTAAPGAWVTETPVTNYDPLKAVLTRFTTLAPEHGQLDIAALVELRDQLAHGRVIPFSPTTAFPLILLKFGRARGGRVKISARIEMNSDWFVEKRSLVDRAIHSVGFWPVLR